MKPYIELDAVARNCICFLAILLVLGFVTNIILAIRQKRPWCGGLAAVFFIAAYFIMQVCRSVSYWKMSGHLFAIGDRFGSIPVIFFIIALVGLVVALAVQTGSIVYYARAHVTPMAVKEAVDLSPMGICYYRENGQVILANHRMNTLAFSITGRALLNGLELFEAVKNEPMVKLQDGTVVRFSGRQFDFSGELCHELIADDVTELYRKSETLREENEHLKLQNEHMKEYGETIDETVRRQEILNTKTSIHDEMNRLLLSTDKAISDGTGEEKQKILETWQKNILLLCMEADSGTKNNALSDLDALSKIIGVNIVYDKMPETEDAGTLSLFSLVVEEAMTNAVKHGGAENLYIHLTEEKDRLQVTLTNDGRDCPDVPTEGGGLSALRSRLEQAGGTMKVSAEEHFALTVSIPKGEKRNVL